MRKTLNTFFLIFLFSIISSSLAATTYTTISSRFWTTNSNWQNGFAPSFTTNDTIIIKNFIEFDTKIVLTGTAYLRVDSTGAFCGHDTIISNAGTSVSTYGILECDLLLVPGGNIIFHPPGNIILTQYAQLSNGANLSSNTTLKVGPWFNCITEISGIVENHVSHFNIYPNPADNLLNVSISEFYYEYSISDLTGRILQSGPRLNNSVNISTIANGIIF